TYDQTTERGGDGQDCPSYLRRLQFGLAFGDDVGLDVARDRAVFGQFHRECALALGHRSEVGRVAEGFGERDLGDDLGDVVDHVGRNHDAAAGGNVADHRALELLRQLQFHEHD